MPLISVIILTLNEEANLPICLESLRGLDADVVVVDSGSSDRTTEIAERFGARVVQHAFETQARQINWALDNVPLTSPWIMRLDADERLTPELREELNSVVATGAGKCRWFSGQATRVLLGTLDPPWWLLSDLVVTGLAGRKGTS